MQYKGIVKVFRENEPEVKPSDYGSVRSYNEATKNKPKPGGKLLEVEVTANTQEALVRKINAMLATLDDDE